MLRLKPKDFKRKPKRPKELVVMLPREEPTEVKTEVRETRTKKINSKRDS